VLRVREHAPIAYPFVVFTFGFEVESIKKLAGASSNINVLFFPTNKQEIGLDTMSWHMNVTCGPIMVVNQSTIIKFWPVILVTN
jgi:hypothetical protein